MPTISTQTDPCCDVIDKLNEEFAEIQDELLATQKQLKVEQLESAREYHINCFANRMEWHPYEFVMDEYQTQTKKIMGSAYMYGIMFNYVENDISDEEQGEGDWSDVPWLDMD